MRGIAPKVVSKLCAAARHPALLTALLVCPLVSAHSSAAGPVRADSSRRPDAAPSGSQARAASQGKGAFKLAYRPVRDKEFAHIEKVVKDSKLFEDLVETSNKELSLPVDISVVFRECDGKDEDPTNAFYSSEDHSITLCYGLIKKSEDLFRNNEKNEGELQEAVLGSTAWTFYHEMGHALIDVYQIAHTGKEEDAADELSTYVLINEGGDEGERMALNGAVDFWHEAAEDNDLSEEKFADSHSLDKQRFYNIVCWVYGSNPEKYNFLAEGDKRVLPEGRAELCEGEYQRITKAWQALLGPHLKK
jgi:hypothetical protein